MMTKVWVGLIGFAIVIGGLSGRISLVSAAALEGAAGAVELFLTLLGIMCLWSGVMAVMQESGLAAKIAKLLSPLTRRLFGRAGKDDEAMELVSANITANLLGLANAATPIGLKAAKRIYDVLGRRGTPHELIVLIVLNTSSIQLIPTTVASIRASFGSQTPYDILPAVWVASVVSVACALLATVFLQKLWKKK